MIYIANLVAMLETYDAKLSKMMERDIKMIDKFVSTDLKLNPMNQKLTKGINEMVQGMEIPDKFNPINTKFIKGISKIMIKGMNIADKFTNTGLNLNFVKDGLETDKIFAAADRSKSNYFEMADAVSKIGSLGGDAFSSGDELIAFTELVQKGLKIGGADTSDQQVTMELLAEAMANGELQGDELMSIMDRAPLIYKSIAKYMGLSEEALRELSLEGDIAADVIKNAIFMAGDEINKTFEDLPGTFEGVWNRIVNGALKAFGPLISNINKLINSEEFQTIIDRFIVSINMIAESIGLLVDFIVDNWSVIWPILAAIGSVLLSNINTKLQGMISPLLAQFDLWKLLTNPIFITVLAIGMVISILGIMGVTFEDVFGFIGGIVGVFIGGFLNGLIKMWNEVAIFVNFLGNIFRDPVSSIQILFYDLMINVLEYTETMAKGIEDIISKIPGVEVDITSGLSNFKNKIKDASKSIKDESGFIEYMQTKEFIDHSDAFAKGSDMGKNIYDGISNKIDGLTNKFIGTDEGFDPNNFNTAPFDPEDFGTSTNPLTIQGTGSGNRVEVDMADEDLQYLRDIAERAYVNKFSAATLAPNVAISFGDVYEEADANKVAGRIKKILEEELAVVAEGDY